MNVIRIHTFIAKPNHIHDLNLPEQARFLSAYCDLTAILGGKSEVRIIASFHVNEKLPEVPVKILSILDDHDMDAYNVFDVVEYLGTAWWAHDGLVTSYYLWELSGLKKPEEASNGCNDSGS